MLRTFSARNGAIALLLLGTLLAPKSASAQKPAARIQGEVNDQERTLFAGSKHPLAHSTADLGAVPTGAQLQGVTLVFSRSAEQEAALQQLLAQQQDPNSSQYHQWLTPEKFAARFGVAEADLSKVKDWLGRQGFTVESVSRSQNRITFSGTVGQVNAAFGTELHYYTQDTAERFAPSTDISIPNALASVVQSVGNLSSFRTEPHLKLRQAVKSDFTSSQSGSHFLTPKDVATIYDINTAYNSGYTGTGQSIAVVGQSAVVLSDIRNFRTAAGLTAKDPTLILMPGTGTSVTSSGDEAESDLDLEYTGGIARDAAIYFVYTGNNTNYGVFDALEYAVDTDVAPIISASYGTCESNLSSSDYTSLNGILAQASAQGQTVIAASGDSGSTDCYPSTSLSTTQRTALAVDFPASSQYVTGLGGSEFSSSNVASSNTTYWSSANGSDVISSALSYIPETVWNDSSSSNGLSSGGGGTSTLTARPTWQSGVTGISSGSYRLVPDVSLAASPSNPGYLYCSSDSTSTGISGSCANGFRDTNSTYLTVAGGTSFAAPVFAGMVAILSQKLGANGLGNINSTLYSLAANAMTYASAFHDITSGSNECTAGSTYCSSTGASEYPATVGYDEPTGLGSVDLYQLILAWSASSTSSLKASVTTLSAATANPNSGASDTITIQVASGSSSSTTTPTGTVSVQVDGASVSSGLTLSNGTATYTFSSTTSGSHVIVASYSGDATYAASSGSAVVTVGSSTTTSGTKIFTLTASSVTIQAGSSGSSTVTVTPINGYTGTVGWSVATSSSLSNACYSISNASITSTSAVSTQLTIYTNSASCTNASSTGGSGQLRKIAGPAASAAANAATPHKPLLAALWLFGAIPLIAWRRKKWMRAAVLSTLLTFALGCGSSTSSSGTNAQKGSYTLTITGTDTSSSSISASGTFTLTID